MAEGQSLQHREMPPCVIHRPHADWDALDCEAPYQVLEGDTNSAVTGKPAAAKLDYGDRHAAVTLDAAAG